uniref:Endonuclease/exonuclease/phosphatase domain-containing protein n=1 Tax=Glycine max TaxID=3847 RepID=A0A088AWU6_SOYBN|nr:hypothetical protein [Glycine max]
MCESDSRRMLVGNIHVLYNPNRGEVKLGQWMYASLDLIHKTLVLSITTQVDVRFTCTTKDVRSNVLRQRILRRAQYLSEKWGNTPVVLAGDFNSTPQLNIMLYDRKELSGQKRCRPAQVLGENKETVGPIVALDGLFKCWTDEEVKLATGDSERHLAVHPLKLNSSYSDGIVPTRVLDTVSISDLLRAGGLPCKKVGSDHLALVSEFSFSVTNNEPTDIVAAAASPIVDIGEPNNQRS